MTFNKSKFPPKRPDNSHIIKARVKLDWSSYQKNIFRDVASNTGHTVVEAYAGSSKTTSIVESFRYIPKGKKALALSFNKIIQEELKSRSPSYVEVFTFHSIGFRAIKQRFGNVELDDYKVFNLVKNQLNDEHPDHDLIANVCDTIAYCKYSLQDTPKQIEDIIINYGIDLCEMDQDKFISLVIKTLNLDKLETSKIDFNDMCWFPFVYNLSLGQYDYVFVDEYQDLNKSQLVMAQKACKLNGGRIIATGDSFQCVDQFTKLETNKGIISIKDVEIGDLVNSYENGKIKLKPVINKIKSTWEHGIKITTKSNKTLTMSPNHKIWAEQQFALFGQNGLNLLKDKYLDFGYPHWISRSATTEHKSRKTIRISSHTIKGTTNVDFEFSDHKLVDIVSQFGTKCPYYKKRPNDLPHYRTRRMFIKYNDAIKYAYSLAEAVNGFVTENISFNKEDDLRLITASGLFIGMKILVKNVNNLIKDEIVSIEKVPGIFYDIEVEDSNNFIGNDILSHNSLYSWRLADTTIINNLKAQPNTKILPLPISYRCPKKIIELAKNWVPDITCPETAIDGEIHNISQNELYKLAKPGCFILSRTNAPLIKICMNLIRNNIRANIRGRDVGKQLNYLIKKSKKKQIVSFLKWLDNWKNDEIIKLKEKNINPENVLDRHECLTNLCDECKTLDEVSKKIDDLFNDVDEKNIVILSTVHRAKGLEREDVFLLKWTFRVWFDHMGLVEKPNEEANIAYVAITRSKNRLFIVNKSIV